MFLGWEFSALNQKFLFSFFAQRVFSLSKSPSYFIAPQAIYKES